MSKGYKVVYMLLAFCLVGAMVAPFAVAEDDTGINHPDARAITRDVVYPAPDPAVKAEAQSERGPAIPISAPAAVPVMSSTAMRSNQCSDVASQLWWNYGAGTNDPFSCGSFERPYTVLNNPTFQDDTLLFVHWFLLYAPEFLGRPAGGWGSNGIPEVTIHIVGDAGGFPDTTNVLASVTRTFADWTTDPAVTAELTGVGSFEGYVPFDFSSSNIVIAKLNSNRLHAVLEITNRYEIIAAGTHDTNSVNTVQVLTDNAGVAPCTDGLPVGSGILRNRGNYQDQVDSACSQTYVWVDWTSLFGADENYAMTWEVATTPPVCLVLSAGVNVETGYVSGGSWNDFGVPFFAGQGIAQPCTVKSIAPFLFEFEPDTLAPTNVPWIFRIQEDDGNGLPGAVVWADTIPYADLVLDFSGQTLIPVPEVVVSGRFHVTGVDSGNAASGTVGWIGAAPGGAAVLDAWEAKRNDSAKWFTDIDPANFGPGGEASFICDMEMCCPPLDFLSCTPASDLDWATQGNGYGRTNATNASLSSLCGLTLAWTAEPGGDVQAIQPIIADDKVLVTSTDLLTCYDKAGGGVLWTFGGFPYIVGDLRGSPTVAGGAVYVGGGGAQAFTKLDLATGAVLWSRNLGGAPDVPLLPGQTNWTPSVVSGGAVYFTQETGNVYKLDDATGADLAGSPLALPDAPGAVPFNALTSDGTKLWVGTADAVGTAGNIHQVDAATMLIDWTLNSPGSIFYPGNTDFYDPEGFPGSMALEGGILYYHSQIRNDGNGFAHFPQTGSIGAIDLAAELGGGEGLLWVNDADANSLASPGLTPAGSYDFSGPAVGPGMIYTTSRGFFGGTTEQDGVAAWDKTIGARIWYQGYKSVGVSGGVGQIDDARCDAPATVFCDPSGTPYVFTGHVGGEWRLSNGNTGERVWTRTFTDRVRGTAMADDCVATVTRTGGPGAGGGAIAVFLVGADRPRLQVDSQFVFRTATPGDGLQADAITDALQNTGCVDLNIASYTTVNPPAVRVLGVSPVLASATKAASRNLQGYDALLDASSAKGRMIVISAGVETDEAEENMARSFASNLSGAADPLFLAVTEAPGAVAAGAAQTLAITYDETGLTNNTGYTNYIEVASDDPDYYPQGAVEAVAGLTTPGVPAIQFELFIGCPDAEAVMTVGLGELWVNNFGAGAGGGSFNDPGPQNFVINGNDANHFDGGWAMVVQDSVHWAFDGCSVSGYPRRAGEFGPTLPCGITIVANNYDSPLGVGLDAVEEISYNMLDLASTNGFFTPSSRQCGGVFMSVQRVASQAGAFGDFVLTRIDIQNEAGDFGDISGDLNDLYFGTVTDWDISGSDNLKQFADGYGQTDGAGGGWGAGNWISGHVNLAGDAVGAGGIGSGGAPTFMSADIQNDQGHGDAAFRMMSDPAGYCATVDPASCDNTDLAALWSGFYVPTLADGATSTFYMAIFQVENGVNGLPWSDAATADAAYADVTCRAKAFAGFGKGDVTCDGVVDLQDVVALGNIVDGLLDPTGTGGVYTADADGDNDYDNDDYNLLYDVVAGVQPASALANGWRF